MVNAKFNTDEHLNEILDVDRHLDHHPGGLWMAEDDGWYDEFYEEMDDENDSDDSISDDPNRRAPYIPYKGRVGESDTDDDNGFNAEEE